MLRLCRESSRSYSGRPVVQPHRQRWERGPAMAAVELQESAEAVVPRATSRGTPRRVSPTREGLNLAGRTRPLLAWSRSVEADWLSYRTAVSVAEKECCLVRKDCQEPPYADPHVRWCGSRGQQCPLRPDVLRRGPDVPENVASKFSSGPIAITNSLSKPIGSAGPSALDRRSLSAWT